MLSNEKPKKPIFNKPDSAPTSVGDSTASNTASTGGMPTGPANLGGLLPSANSAKGGRPSNASRAAAEAEKNKADRRAELFKRILKPEGFVPIVRLIPNGAFLATKDPVFIVPDDEALRHSTALCAVLELYADDIEDPRVLVVGAFLLDYTFSIGGRFADHVKNMQRKKSDVRE